MPHIKTTISLEQSLFDELVRLAHILQISRSQLLADALVEYLECRSNHEMLARINEAYAEEPDDAERAVLQHARQQHRLITGG